MAARNGKKREQNRGNTGVVPLSSLKFSSTIPMSLPVAIKLSLYCKKHIVHSPAPAFIAKSAIFILIKF